MGNDSRRIYETVGFLGDYGQDFKINRINKMNMLIL